MSKRNQKSAEQLLAEAQIARQTTQDAPGDRFRALTAQGLGQGVQRAQVAINAIPAAEEAYALRIAGYQFGEIAQHLNLTRAKNGSELLTEAAVVDLITGLANTRRLTTRESVTSIFQIELDRLDILIKGLWSMAEKGDGTAVDRVLRVMIRKAEMLGLDAPEVRAMFHFSSSEMDFSELSEPEVRQLRELMEKATPKTKTTRTRAVADVLEGEIVEQENKAGAFRK